MAVLCGMPKYIIRLEVVRYLCTSCLLPAFDNAQCHVLRLSDISVICRVTYFQFPIQVFFSSMSVRQAAQRRIGLRNIGHRTLPKIWVGTCIVHGVQPRGMILN